MTALTTQPSVISWIGQKYYTPQVWLILIPSSILLLICDNHNFLKVSLTPFKINKLLFSMCKSFVFASCHSVTLIPPSRYLLLSTIWNSLMLVSLSIILFSRCVLIKFPHKAPHYYPGHPTCESTVTQNALIYLSPNFTMLGTMERKKDVRNWACLRLKQAIVAVWRVILG